MDRLHRLVDEHRRLLAAVCAGLAVLAGLSAMTQAPQTRPVLVAAHDLTSGQVVTTDDVRTAAVPPDAAPGATLSRREALGRRVAGPMRAGEAFTDYRVIGPGSLDGYGDGAVFTTIRVDRADVASIGVGDHVDVVAVAPGGESPAEIVARDVEVVTVPDATDDDSGVDAASSLGVVTTEQGALALAQAGLSSRLSVLATTG